MKYENCLYTYICILLAIVFFVKNMEDERNTDFHVSNNNTSYFSDMPANVWKLIWIYSENNKKKFYMQNYSRNPRKSDKNVKY